METVINGDEDDGVGVGNTVEIICLWDDTLGTSGVGARLLETM